MSRLPCLHARNEQLAQTRALEKTRCFMSCMRSPYRTSLASPNASCTSAVSLPLAFVRKCSGVSRRRASVSRRPRGVVFFIATMATSYHVFMECPLKHECSEASFKKASCWGWTPEEAKERLKTHLMKSGNHKHNDFTDDTVETILESVMGELQELPWTPANKGKKRHLHYDGYDGGAQYDGGARPYDSHTSSVVWETLRQLDARDKPSDSQAMQLAQPQPKRKPQEKEKGVTLRVEQARLCRDALTRAHTAARHAQRLCSAAATAFSDEAETIAEAQKIFNKLIPKQDD